jgi:hypothetical protein
VAIAADSGVKRRGWRRSALIASGVYLASSVALAAWLLPTGRETPPTSFAAPQERGALWGGAKTADADRALALQRAAVWAPTVIAAVDFAANPPDPSGQLSQPLVRCRYLDRPARGTTPKFDCVLPDGEVVKVKYGHTGEIHAEIAATRLLAGLGFGADRMYLVPGVRCYGCVRTPFYTVWALDMLRARDVFTRSVPEDSYTDFAWPAVERRFDGLEIDGGRDGGWAWYELASTDPLRRDSRAERDALRLVAMLLAHWDNKAPNQRLVCLASPADSAGPCPRPFALIQDLGATFGPNKVDLDHWKRAPIWADASRCTVSMRQFPYSGATFQDTEISEAGRQLIVRQLAALSDAQRIALFTAARFAEFHGGRGPDADPRAWASALHDKIQQIATTGPCPTP